MLVLSVKYGESVVIQTPEGDVDVKVCNRRRITKHQSGYVKLSFTAPESIKIYRSELLKGKENDRMETSNER